VAAKGLAPKRKLTSRDCVACGLCCLASRPQSAFADVTAEDVKRLGKRFVRLHVLYPGPLEAFSRVIDGRPLHGALRAVVREQKAGPLKGHVVTACVALKGTVLKSVRCSVYANRPEVCRQAVKPGDPVCRRLRAVYSSVRTTS
jgi:Fe-S-cluster containining protein